MPDLEIGHYPQSANEWLLRGAPTAVAGAGEQAGRCNLGPTELTTDNAAFTTGQVLYVAIPLFKNDVIRNVGFKVGATAGATLTHFFGALYDPAGTLIAQSTDQELLTITSGIPAKTTGVTALAANKLAGFVLGSQASPTAYTVPSTGVYYIGIGITGTTLPSMIGKALATASCQGAPLGTAAASRTGNQYTAFVPLPGTGGTIAGNFYNEPCLSQLDASTATGTAPATITTNGTPTASTKLPAVYAW